MAPPKVVIVGGGVGGATTAQALQGVAEVTVVDRRDYFEIPYSNVRLPVDPAAADKSIWPLKDTPKIGKVVQASVSSITSSEIILDTGARLPYDYLVLATGSKYADALSSGTSPSMAERKAEIKNFNATLSKAKSVLVIGGGPVGMEVAGEISTDMPGKKVTMVHAEERLLPDFPLKAHKLLLKTLKKQGVEVVLDEMANKQGSGYVLSKSGRNIEADVVYLCIGGKPNTQFLAADNGDVLNSKGFVKVDDYLRVEGRSNWFAIGDITSLPDGRLGRIADAQAHFLAEYIKASQAGGAALKKIKPWKKNGGIDVIVVTLGRKSAIMSIFGWSFGGCIPVNFKAKDNMVGMVRKNMGMPKV